MNDDRMTRGNGDGSPRVSRPPDDLGPEYRIGPERGRFADEPDEFGRLPREGMADESDMEDERAYTRDRYAAREHGREHGEVSVPTLLRSLAGDATTLTRKEVALARTEVREAISDLKVGIVSSAAGGGVMFAGLLFLMLSVTMALATMMEPWLAALLVGGAVTLFGIILVLTGKKKLEAENYRPERTAKAMHKDQEMLHRRTR
jgi:hypothetical protein